MTKEDVADPLSDDEHTPLDFANSLPERRKKPMVHAAAPAPLPKDYDPPPQTTAILTTIGLLEEPLGNARLHVARLIAALIQTNTTSVNQELCRLSTMDLLLDNEPDPSKITKAASHGTTAVCKRGPDETRLHSTAFTFFDPNDPACQEILYDPKTTVPELFAIIRQWVPQVQHKIDIIGNEILKRGGHVNDRDGLTDMTLLHYACKAGAHGVGDPSAAVRLSSQLLLLGADVTLRSRWTNMNALHYAAYFDVPELIRILLKSSKPKVVNTTCSDFNHGTALHIAASNLCLGAVKCLLEHGANPTVRNSIGQNPADVVPDPMDMTLDKAESAMVAKELKQLLLDAVPLSCNLPKVTLPNYDNIPGNLMLISIGLKLGDRVLVDAEKAGTLRFCGTTEFASGQWVGVELDEPEGKNDGSVGGIRYFICPPKHGLFSSVSKITKAPLEQTPSSVTSTPRTPRMDFSRMTGKGRKEKKEKALRKKSPSVASLDREGLKVDVGDQVLVAGQKQGIVKFYGKTDFAPGYWFGIELDKPTGKHDGSVFGVRYFTCIPKHGVFAPPSRVQRIGAAKESQSDNNLVKKVHQVTITQPKRNFTAVRTPKDITSENSISRLLFCCWFPWMLRAEMQS